jgi:hypothetical protein
MGEADIVGGDVVLEVDEGLVALCLDLEDRCGRLDSFARRRADGFPGAGALGRQEGLQPLVPDGPRAGLRGEMDHRRPAAGDE